jgi:NAD+ diphosphatase
MTLPFSGSPLDRADQMRGDPAAMAALMGPQARLLLLDGLDPRAGDGGLTWGSLADADPAADLVFLGLDPAGSGCFAAVPPAGSTAPGNPRIWLALAALPPGDLATYGTARSLANWHARHRFCANCGGPTALAKSGWQRSCTACAAEHFPRVDPVTIMLVQHTDDRGDNLLLGRQPRFPEGNYSALAGFVEPGETIEEAVAREVYEEAGVRVRDISYISSQPWPFPSNLMIGCLSHADDPALTIDHSELEDARWFSRSEVKQAMAGDPAAKFNAPGHQAIAHHLLRWWLERG